jgi:hypothetical protein
MRAAKWVKENRAVLTRAVKMAGSLSNSRKHSMNCRALLTTLIALLSVAVSTPATAQQPSCEKNSVKGKKLIEWGWDEPDTKFMRENIEKMEQYPFDGLVFHDERHEGQSLLGGVGKQKVLGRRF